MSSFRKNKLEHQILRIIGNVLLTELKDPRVEFISVSRVDLSSDLSHAEVFYSILGDEKAKKDAGYGLKSARGYIKKIVGNSLQMRHVPDISFTYDDSVEKGVDLVNLIDSVNDNSDKISASD
jgi:ribosome-binding factor A